MCFSEKFICIAIMLYMIKKWHESLDQDCTTWAFVTDHSKAFKIDLIIVLEITLMEQERGR